MALVFGWALRCEHSPSGSLGKIGDEETGEDFLENEVRLLCVKVDEAHGTLQAAEGAPASGVEGPEDGKGEMARIQIGDQGFHIAAVGL